MKNKGFINPQISLFILAGLLVTGGVLFGLKNGVFNQNDVLGDAVAQVPTGVPKLTYKRVKVMQTLKGQTFRSTDLKYNGKLAKGYVFKAFPGQRLEVVAAETLPDYSYIDTYLFDKNGRLLLDGDTRLDFDEYDNIRRDYSGDYYVVVTTSNPAYNKFDLTVNDYHQIHPVVRVRDFGTSKIYNVTEALYMNPDYAVPVKKGNIIIDLNQDFNNYNWTPQYGVFLKMWILAGTREQHVAQKAESSIINNDDYVYAEDLGGSIPLEAGQVLNDTLYFFTGGGDYVYGPAIELPATSQISVPLTQYLKNPQLAYRSVLRFWTR